MAGAGDLRKNPLTETETEVRETPYSKGEWRVVECLSTGMVYLQNPPDYSRLTEEFAWEKTYEEEKERRKKKEPVISFLSDAGKAARRLQKRERIEKVVTRLLVELAEKRGKSERLSMVDVGCGTGEKSIRIAEWMKENHGVSISPIGVEISDQLAVESHERMSALGGKCVHNAAVEGIESLEDDSVDMVILCSYLEHEINPLGVLRAVSKKLIQGGFVVIKVPNYACWNRSFRQKKWCGFRYPDHVNYFTPTTLRQMIEKGGLSLHKMNFFDRFPTNDNVWLVGTK